MATKSQATKVGVFLIACGVLAATVFIMLTGITPQERPQYKVVFNEDVAGLSNGSKVMFRGVECGRVLNMIVNATGEVVVSIEVYPDSIPPLREGVKAQLVPVGVSGLSRVVLSGGDPEAPRLEEGASIPSRPSFLNELVQNLPVIQQGIQNAIDLISEVFSHVEPEDVGQLVSEAAGLASSLRSGAPDVIGSITTTLGSYRDLADEVRGEVPAISASLQSAATSTSRLLDEVGPQVEEVVPALRDALRQAEQTFAEVERQLVAFDAPSLRPAIEDSIGVITRAAKQLDALSENATLAVDELRGDADTVGYELTEALRSFRETLRAARRLAELLERDPAALIRGRRAAKEEQ